ncbi:arginyl-tRNA--protein transferase 1 isoform X3 [Dermacentor silvarum]|uniref:arginyl-tRNA--protein transferase 1 isoform X3 n=1 Tax=Dermacentor silvarum TaxID=543639 RepID=UPI001897E087|nr:arginyl-tRNA--protein transferase 1 isoform X3 [Dermacentor silvarum]
MDDDYGIVEYFYEHNGHRCGYCKSESSSLSCGMWAHRLTAGIYDDLLNRGWRRSGEYCYKPVMKKTCCRQYPIKLDVAEFSLTKSQKKLLKRIHKFLATGKRNESGKPDEKGDHCSETMGDRVMEMPDFSDKKSNVQLDLETCNLKPSGEDTVTSESAANEEIMISDSMDQHPEKPQECSKEETVSKSEMTAHVPKKGLGADPNKPKCRKARDIRRERKLLKLSSAGKDLSPGGDKAPLSSKKPKNEPKSLEDFLFEPLPPDAAHKLEYDPKGPYSLGSFHQQYWLDGNLIAVGVIDILPTCLSSVYLYYNPDYSFLSLGTYASLREIAYARELQKICPSIKDYCMGFYIHTCPKMRYKGNFSPSRLLCPETYTWHPIEKCKPLLDANKYCRFEQDPNKGDENAVQDLDEVSILYNRTVITYKKYCRLKGNADKAEVKEYANLVGKKCIKRLFLYRKS